MTIISQCFLDESGSGREGGTFFVGGYAGLVEMWKAFADDWQAVLDGKRDGLPPWPPSHAVNIENGKEGFDVLNPTQRKKRLGRLVDVIRKHRPYAVLGKINVDKFIGRVNDVWREKGVNARPEHWTKPYQFAAAHLYGALYKFQDEIDKWQGHKLGTMEVVFDNMDKLAAPVGKKIEEGVRAWVQKEAPSHVYERLAKPRWTKNNERANYPHLQAADLLVWHYSRANNSADGRYRRAFRDIEKATPPFFITEKDGADSQEYWIQSHTEELLQRIRARRLLSEQKRAQRQGGGDNARA